MLALHRAELQVTVEMNTMTSSHHIHISFLLSLPLFSVQSFHSTPLLLMYLLLLHS